MSEPEITVTGTDSVGATTAPRLTPGCPGVMEQLRCAAAAQRAFSPAADSDRQ